MEEAPDHLLHSHPGPWFASIARRFGLEGSRTPRSHKKPSSLTRTQSVAVPNLLLKIRTLSLSLSIIFDLFRTKMDDDFDMAAPGGEMMDDFDLPDEGPILKVGEEKEIGKQGLKKKLLKEGESWETPKSGDEVEGARSSLLF